MDSSVAVGKIMPNQDQPFNGDTFVQKTFLWLKQKYNLKTAVETGSAVFGTTIWLGEHFEKVHTIEINESYRNYGLGLIAGKKHIHSHIGDSGDLMKGIARECGNDTIFFLDAHWGNHCPLKKELRAIGSVSITPVIVIHDFKVPNEPKLGFDMINDQPFSLKWLKHDFDYIYGDGCWAYHYNSDKESTEIKRGVIYVYPKS